MTEAPTRVTGEGFLCRRCLATWEVKLPLSARLYLAAIDAFLAIHALCKQDEARP